jgi:hypothetical protein
MVTISIIGFNITKTKFNKLTKISIMGINGFNIASIKVIANFNIGVRSDKTVVSIFKSTCTIGINEFKIIVTKFKSTCTIGINEFKIIVTKFKTGVKIGNKEINKSPTAFINAEKIYIITVIMGIKATNN